MTAYWDGWIADAVLLLMVVALAIYIWRLTELLDGVARRHELLQQSIGSLPRAGEMTDLRVQVASLDAKQASVLAEVHSTRAATRRIEDFLLRASRKDHDSQF